LTCIFIDDELHARSIFWDDIEWSDYAEQLKWIRNLPLGVIHDPEEGYWGYAVKLSPSGGIEKTLGSGFHGHNRYIAIERLANTNFVTVIEYRLSGFGLVIALYCTETGALFSLQN